MKRFFTFFCAVLSIICANATSDEFYIETSKVSTTTTGTINVMLKNSQDMSTIGGTFYFPKGIKPISIQSTCEVPCSGNFVESGVDGENYYNIIYNSIEGKKIPASSIAKCIGKITVEVDPTQVSVGESYEVVGKKIELVDVNKDVTHPEENRTELVAQKAAVIDPQRDDYSFEAVPTCVATGSTSMSLPVNFANEGYVVNISFNIVYPDGMLTTKSGKNYNITVNKDRFDTGSDATLTVKAASGTDVSFTNGNSDLVEPGNGNLLTIPVTLTNVADGVYTIKFTDIKVSVTNDEADPISTETLPDYYVSVVVGQPSAQEAILYGNYDIATIESFNTALKNVAAANITAINSENKDYFKDIITVDDNKKWCYYYRESEKYATTVMPYDLEVTPESQSYCTLYRVEDMTSESIFIKELSQGECIPANTPCIFKGTLSFLKENMPLNFGEIDKQDFGFTKFTGTYEATELAYGEGYYIFGGAFYNDGASISPFRAFFKGNVNGVKSFSVKLDTPNGLIDITDQLSDEAIYSLQGIRMSNAQKGINIKGGKKVYVK